MSERLCVQCKAPDREIVLRPKTTEEESSHFVVPEIRYFRGNEDITTRMRAQGWIPKVFQGRRAMYRFMCVNCLNANEVRDRVWDQLRESARKLEKPGKNADAEFYAQLCEVS